MTKVCDIKGSHQKYAAAIKRTLFGDFPDEELQYLLDAAEEKKYSKRDKVFDAGDCAKNFYIVIGGWIKLFNLTPDGEEIVVGIYGPGQFFGESIIFDDKVYPYSAEAAAEAILLEIPANVLTDRAYANPDVAKQVLYAMSRDIEKLQIENGHLALMDNAERLACMILRLSSWMVGKGGTFRLPYSKYIAAVKLGMDVASFSRTLKKLEDKGVFCNGSEVCVEDFTTLSEFCCRSCPVPASKCAGRHCGDSIRGISNTKE